ncbi:hypothetical protein ACFLZP_02600, partial [Patescibacteria group bacterium]
SGYGLATQDGSGDNLVGLLMIDRPRPADLGWLADVEAVFGDYQLAVMSANGDRGIACQMQIEPENSRFLRKFPGPLTSSIKEILGPLLEVPPNPVFSLRWQEDARAWTSQFAVPTELPPVVRQAFERVGYGCLTAETNIGAIHICHASDVDIEGFADKKVWYQWQLVKMPTAPLIRFELAIQDDPENPYGFETFLNVTGPGQAEVLTQLAGQDRLYFAFYGDDLTHRFTKIVDHDQAMRERLGRLSAQAIEHWERIPPGQRDFDRAKREFQSRSS